MGGISRRYFCGLAVGFGIDSGLLLEFAANAKVRLIVWCKACGHQVEPDADEMAARYGADPSVLDWRDRLVCSECGGRQVDIVVTGTERR